MVGLFNFLQYSTYSIVFGSASAALAYLGTEEEDAEEIKLVQVGPDWIPEIQSYNPPTVRTIELPDKKRRVNLKRLRRRMKELEAKYKKYDWNLKPVVIGNTKLWRYERTGGDSKSEPIFFNAKTGAIFVSRDSLDREPKLLAKIVSFRLGDLKLSYHLGYA
jgi:hypothetical protein